MVKVQSFVYRPLPTPTAPAASGKKSAATFAQSLKQEQAKLPVKLSKHARERIDLRHIHISDAEWQTIHAKMQEAEQMGISDSLVLTKDAALVVNTPSRTVITAMGLNEAKDRIFSNIDGTIVINH